jgi:mannobiose 2-epimerase
MIAHRLASASKVIGALLLIVTVLAIAATTGAQAQQPSPADSVLDGEFWKRQGLRQILPAWTEHAADPEARGAFFAELSRDWTPNRSADKYPGMVGRHLFSYAAAYLMSGDDAHLNRARDALDFMLERGWDEKHGGFYNAVSRTGSRVTDSSKDLFMQIYAATGLALYYAATHSERAMRYLKRTNRLIEKHAWDDERGGYVRGLNRDLSVNETYKDFSPQLAPLSGYLLYLHRATRNETYLRQAERIMEVVLNNMRDDETGWILERFDRSWQFLPDDRKNQWVNVGHNVEVAWVLLRLHMLTDKPRYRRLALQLNRRLTEHAFTKTGAWAHRLKAERPSEHPKTTPWWVQAYGNFLQLYVHRATGDAAALQRFQRGARFWNEHFVDRRSGGTVLAASLDGGGVTRGDKAVRTKTSYHALEHSLLGYLLVSLWVEGNAATQHFRVDDPAPNEKLYPVLIEGEGVAVRRAVVNGQERAVAQDGGVPLPASGPARIEVTLTSDSVLASAEEAARFDLVLYGRGLASGEHRVLLKTNPGEGEEWEQVGTLAPQTAAGEWRAVITATDLSRERYFGQDFRENHLSLKIVTPEGSGGEAQLGAVYAVPHRNENTAERLTRVIAERPQVVRRRSMASYVRPHPMRLRAGTPFVTNIEAPVRFDKIGVAEVKWLKVLFSGDG